MRAILWCTRCTLGSGPPAQYTYRGVPSSPRSSSRASDHAEWSAPARSIIRTRAPPEAYLKLVALTSTLPPTNYGPSCSAGARSSHPPLFLRRDAPLLRLHQRSLVIQSRDGAAAVASAVYCLQKRCDASQAEVDGRCGLRSVGGGRRGDLEPSAAAPRRLPGPGDIRGVYERCL